jgi:hypothetical protein
VPNQEKILNHSKLVTYRDSLGNMLEILLPNWEIKQEEFRAGPTNSFALQAEQEWEWPRYQKRPDVHSSGLYEPVI